MVTPVCKSRGTLTSGVRVKVPLDSAAYLWEAISDMAIGETHDWLIVGASGALFDHAIDGGRPA